MFHFDLEYNKNEKTSEGHPDEDREYYLMGRTGYPKGPSQRLSGRHRGCYMMGYNTSKWEDNNETT